MLILIFDLYNFKSTNLKKIFRLYLEIKGKENELTSHVKQIKTLENQCRELQKKEAESTQWSRVSTSEFIKKNSIRVFMEQCDVFLENTFLFNIYKAKYSTLK